MSVCKYFDRISFIDQLIRMQSTGNPESFALKLGISKRHLQNYIREMRLMGAPIDYSKTKQTYYYRSEGRFVYGFKKNDFSGI